TEFMTADGPAQTRPTNSRQADFTPAYSPDGTKIVFTSTRSGNAELWIMNANGTSPTRLTTNMAIDSGGVWSSTNRIAFASRRDGNLEIYAVDPNGANLTRLTNNTTPDINPDWSADGTRIAFSSFRDGNFEIYVMNANGSGQTRLTNMAGAALEMRQPDHLQHVAAALRELGLPGE